MKPAANLEFAKSSGLSLEAAIHAAAEIGYSLVEPYIYTPIRQPINSHLEIVSKTEYHHLDSSRDRPKEIRALLDKTGTAFSALDAHCTLLMPQVGVPYLQEAIRFAAEVECPIVMSDEGPLATDWMDLDAALEVMCFSLDAVVKEARARGVLFAVELHNALTAEPEYLLKVLDRFGPEVLGVNFDTGNSYLAGNNPVEYVRQVADRVVHVHIKDIPAEQNHLRGKITGTRVGVTAGQGEIDLPGVVRELAQAGYEGAMSVECDTLEQVTESLPYLTQLFTKNETTSTSA